MRSEGDQKIAIARRGHSLQREVGAVGTPESGEFRARYPIVRSPQELYHSAPQHLHSRAAYDRSTPAAVPPLTHLG